MIDKIVDFFIKEGDGLFKEEQRGELTNHIINHIVYGTLKCWFDGNGISAAARWNWVSNNQVEVLDAVVRKDLRNKDVALFLAKRCLEENPSCIGIFFQDKQQKRRFYRKREYFFRRNFNESNVK